MPAFSTHYIFASELMAELKSYAPFELNKDAVLIGSQGPDIFFFHRVFPWLKGKSLRQLGSKMHRTRPADILNAMKLYCKRAENPDIALSYTYGFILHYALDSTCHPYVYSMQDRLISEGEFKNKHTAHNTIEFAMDCYLLNKRLGINEPYAFDTEHTLSITPEASTEIARLYCYIIPKLYADTVTEGDIVTAISDTAYVQKATLDVSGFKRRLLTPVEGMLSPFTHGYKLTAMMRPRDLEKAKKYANIEKRLWKYPTADKESNMSFEELFESAKPVAVNIIKAFCEDKLLEDITKNKSFLTGVEI